MEKKEIVKKALAPFLQLGMLSAEDINAIETCMQTAKGKASKLMTVKDVCNALGVSRPTLLAIRKKGELKATKINGNAIRFKADEIEEYITKNQNDQITKNKIKDAAGNDEVISKNKIKDAAGDDEVI